MRISELVGEEGKVAAQMSDSERANEEELKSLDAENKQELEQIQRKVPRFRVALFTTMWGCRRDFFSLIATFCIRGRHGSCAQGRHMSRAHVRVGGITCTQPATRGPARTCAPARSDGLVMMLNGK